MNAGLKNEFSMMAMLFSAVSFIRKKPLLGAITAATALAVRYLGRSATSFLNSSVVITGGSRGLGLALAKRFADEGASVALLARDSEELEYARKILERSHPTLRALTIDCDITIPGQLADALEKVKLHFGKIDVLVNNAGSISVGPFESMDSIDFEAQMKLHFSASLDAIQKVVPYLKQSGGGKIINISSIGGKIPVPHLAPYCASKFALAGLSETLSAELKKDGICVTTVYPGLMRTGSPIQAVFKGDYEKEYAWFAMSDNTPGISVSAETAAHVIVKAARNELSHIVISIPAKIAVLFFNLFPETFSALIRIVTRLMPQNISHDRRTGAESQHWLRQQRWSRSLRSIEQEAQTDWNQKPHYDADHQMGVDRQIGA